MDDRRLVIDPDIRQARTLPSWVYCDPQTHAAIRERVFARSWQVAGDLDAVRVPGQVAPFTLLEGCLDEPLSWVRDGGDRLRCLSNVCTHRGMLVCEGGGVHQVLRCRYHGRRFGLDGRFLSMPEFDAVADFPAPADDLREIPGGSLGRILWAALAPEVPLERLLAPFMERCGFLPLAAAVIDPARSRDYLVQANWALYCDNYLEGFHIPFVHPGLSAAIDYGEYRTELFDFSNLQLGVAAGGDETFALPAGHPDSGIAVAAWYFWLFPNTMLNVYPWGISVNVVRPLAVDRTRVSFLSYVWDPSRLDRGAGAALDRVEREDESVVEAVQRGLRSRVYRCGRYSSIRETGVHHFHRLLAERLG